ncbi:MAG: CDGSH iron-sulfur domain-containing protein [Candidatus Diapherotrites archaeon]|nr:CDGSH iron-sulfur domain-containing protein [Candidatus Diapherotrites archaeon]
MDSSNKNIKKANMQKGRTFAEINITENGPYIVSGRVPLRKEIIAIGSDNEPQKWLKAEAFKSKKTYALCRCGGSKNKPYCDGTHILINFDGTETADNASYIEKAKKYSGPELDLLDWPELCASARFCHRANGIWNLIKKSSDKKMRKIAIESACNCPSGRLVALEKNGGKIEPKHKKGIALVEDPQAKCSGPIWVKGGIPIKSSKGFYYEKRNRVTLCRCGASSNKPFCDGTHISIGFKADKKPKK